MLFSPKVFQVGTSGNNGVGVSIHAGKMGDDARVGKTNNSTDSLRWRVQFGC